MWPVFVFLKEIYIYIYIYIYTRSYTFRSCSQHGFLLNMIWSCMNVYITDNNSGFSDSISPWVPIIHCSWHVHNTNSIVRTELIYVCKSLLVGHHLRFHLYESRNHRFLVIPYFSYSDPHVWFDLLGLFVRLEVSGPTDASSLVGAFRMGSNQVLTSWLVTILLFSPCI